MRAAVFRGVGQPLALETLPDPEPGPDDVIIEVHRCGICGTDLHLTSGEQSGMPEGSVMGHEYAGVVVELGSAVHDYRVGDVITALPSTGCGECEACRHDNVTLCFGWPGVVGGFGEFLRVPTSTAIKLSSALSVADGALVEPLAVGRYATRLAALHRDARILVLGAGALALCTVYWLRRSGAARIVAMSRSPLRAEMAISMGADAFVQSGENEIGEAIEALGGPPDVVFECIGVPGGLTRAVGHVRPFGQVVSMGFCTSPDMLVPAMAGMKAVSLQFPVAYTMGDFQHVADVMAAGHVDPKMLISSVVSLDDLPHAFERLRRPNTETKVHVAPTGG
ncbi:zinc-dependent alcohol dehydrogenase [Jatrophihabitans sp. DSM 45814]